MTWSDFEMSCIRMSEYVIHLKSVHFIYLSKLEMNTLALEVMSMKRSISLLIVLTDYVSTSFKTG